MRASDPWVVRAYVNEDQMAVDDLLDENSDGLFVAQGHSLHGPPREGECWRRTLVAEIDAHVVGAVTIARNRVHPARYSQAVEVAASHRRRGLGRALINAVSQLRPEKRPFAGKVRSSDGRALSFLDKLGGRIIQTSPCPRPDPSSNGIRGRRCPGHESDPYRYADLKSAIGIPRLISREGGETRPPYDDQLGSSAATR